MAKKRWKKYRYAKNRPSKPGPRKKKKKAKR